MNKYYTGEGKIEYCYKVNFNFKDGLSSGKDNYDFSSWAIELSRYFTSKFGRGKTGYNQGEIEFKNELCDYMTYQGSRFIIQFHLKDHLFKYLNLFFIWYINLIIG